jgi:hypothetical protein
MFHPMDDDDDAKMRWQQIVCVHVHCSAKTVGDLCSFIIIINITNKRTKACISEVIYSHCGRNMKP